MSDHLGQIRVGSSREKSNPRTIKCAAFQVPCLRTQEKARKKIREIIIEIY